METADGVRELVGRERFDIVLSDLHLRELDGVTLVRCLVDVTPTTRMILMTGDPSLESALEAIDVGVSGYLTKPLDMEAVSALVGRALEKAQLAQEAADLRERVEQRLSFGGILGDHPSMQRVLKMVGQVARSRATVLVQGESGTGKELIAAAIHQNSPRAKRPFVRLNCAALAENLLESELFGHVRGAFTGAVRDALGHFQSAAGGTIFLDEIAEIPPSMQVKLLRALQEQEFERVGGIKTLRVDVRFLAAPNRDLPAEFDAGRFREDLSYRLHVVHVALAPLRERATYIPLLLDHFVARFNARLGRQVEGFAPEVVAQLARAPWRGNIRELENVVERCMPFVDGPRILMEHLPPALLARTSGVERGDMGAVADALDASAGLKDVVRQATSRLEKELIVRALDQTQGNVTRAAKLLKISRKSLQTKMKELGLRDEPS